MSHSTIGPEGSGSEKDVYYHQDQFPHRLKNHPLIYFPSPIMPSHMVLVELTRDYTMNPTNTVKTIPKLHNRNFS